MTDLTMPRSQPEPANSSGTRDPLFARRLTTCIVLPLVLLTSLLDGVIPPAGIPLALLVIWIYLKRTGHRWVDLGFSRPRSWRRTLLLALVTVGIFKLALNPGIGWLVNVLGLGVPDASRFNPLEGNWGMLAMYLVVAWTTAGFGEEIIWRGFLMRGVARLFGGARFAWIASLVLTSALFGVLHAYQGPAGILSTGIVGLALGVVFLVNGRNLWIPVLVHAMIDTISFVMLFLGME